MTALNIPFIINPVLVRGLDYYGHTVFEWVTDKLGSQATICAGGRYDMLVEQLGGHATPAVGFALGIERILLLMDTLNCVQQKDEPLALFIMATNSQAAITAHIIADSIRTAYPAITVINNTAGGSFKSQFKKADKSGARLALILGDDEVANQQISVKDLRTASEQVTIEQQSINQFINNYLQ